MFITEREPQKNRLEELANQATTNTLGDDDALVFLELILNTSTDAPVVKPESDKRLVSFLSEDPNYVSGRGARIEQLIADELEE